MTYVEKQEDLDASSTTVYVSLSRRLQVCTHCGMGLIGWLLLCKI